ncbi:hypothetical protein S2M10_21740 [Sphingomonas sp. S2M10]|nr:hypothetical protein [Sphingomonas sp. S2M10]
MEFSLLPHPATPPIAVTAVVCDVRRQGADIALHYRILVDPAALVLPAPAAPERTDGLWRTTCLELFVAGEASDYREFNFAPSGPWAAYAFTGRRAGMAPLVVDETPKIGLAAQEDALVVAVHLCDVGTGALRLGITAVMEERDGTKSYWALRHGGDAPDFHDPDCFVAQLPPAD